MKGKGDTMLLVEGRGMEVAASTPSAKMEVGASLLMAASIFLNCPLVVDPTRRRCQPETHNSYRGGGGAHGMHATLGLATCPR